MSNYKNIIVVYCLLMFGLFTPFWLFGEVIAPYQQRVEVGATDNQVDHNYIENHKFSDYNNGYIPEVYHNLTGNRSSWLTTWTNENELGRPTDHTSGFSTAYFLSWVITHFTDDPWWFLTILSLSFCFFTGIFVILFCREINLHPLAGLIAGSSLASSPDFMYWLTFPMFTAVWCWTAGALVGITRIARKPDLIGWGILAFSVYSLLMTGYQQLIVYQIYILAGYELFLAYRQQLVVDAGWFILLSTSAIMIGALLTLPMYVDLFHLANESARVAPDLSFFTAIMPNFTSLTNVLQFMVMTMTPELFGNPISPSYPFSYDGCSVTLLVIFFTVIGLIVEFKKISGWLLIILIIIMITIFPPLYAFGVKYLLLNLSRTVPTDCILLPLTIIAAYGADTLFRRTIPGELYHVVLISVSVVLVIIAMGLSFGMAQAVPINWNMVLVMLFLVALFLAQYNKTHPLLLIMALVVDIMMISYPLMLRQNPAQITKTSPLIARISDSIPKDSRFAVAAPGLSILPPNLNAGLDISSIHSYNSLSSKHYHTLIESLGGKMQTYGRHNGLIAPDYNSAMFWMSNISLMLSPMQLTHENLEYLGSESSVHFYKVSSRMGDSLQIVHPPIGTPTDGLDMVDPRLLQKLTASKQLDQGDLLEFVVTSVSVPSILILSQKFHRDWQARIFTSDWITAKVMIINNVFQGVVLPQDTQRVRLEFKPYVRYAWIAHVFWLFLMALFGIRSLANLQRRQFQSSPRE